MEAHTIRDWLMHSLTLCQSRCASASGIELRALKRELLLRQLVMSVPVAELNGSALIWHRYVNEHARLQQLRYSRQITEAEFHVRASRLLKWRDHEDNRARHLPWRKGK